MNNKEALAPMNIVWEMIQEANVPIYYCYFENLFVSLDTSHRKTMDLKDFHKLVTIILEHKEELGAIFENYCVKKKPGEESNEDALINFDQLQNLLRDVQGDIVSKDSVKIIAEVANSFIYSEYGNIKKLAADSPNPNAFLDISATETQRVSQASENKVVFNRQSMDLMKGINLLGLSKMMFSKSNCAISFKANNTIKRENPLYHYLINTSHYTYLMYDPDALSVEATAKNYSKYLQKGIRCVDISLIVTIFSKFLGWT
jgi:hypothetical protein